MEHGIRKVSDEMSRRELGCQSRIHHNGGIEAFWLFRFESSTATSVTLISSINLQWCHITCHITRYVHNSIIHIALVVDVDVVNVDAVGLDCSSGQLHHNCIGLLLLKTTFFTHFTHFTHLPPLP